MNRPLPTPEALDQSPELAVLALLDSALQVARTALLCVHGELRSIEGLENRNAVPTSTLVAHALIALADVLSCHITLYHDTLENEHLRRLDQISQRDF